MVPHRRRQDRGPYLALAAFTIMLRRLRATRQDDGTGVAVLMRYTLRLLTVQQFQRAAAMITACELLRRRATRRGPDDSRPRHGANRHWPSGVGAAATPLTLREALNRAPGDPSTPEQLTTCPCCGVELNWELSPLESTVECTSDATTCELAESGAHGYRCGRLTKKCIVTCHRCLSAQ